MIDSLSPEKAGVGGSTPSLATICFSDLADQPKISTPVISPVVSHSPNFDNRGTDPLRSTLARFTGLMLSSVISVAERIGLKATLEPRVT